MITYIKMRIKKIIAIFVAAVALGVFCVPPVRAELGGLAELYLSYIMQYTYGTLVAVNEIPTYLNQLMVLASNWQQPDTSDTTANIQGMFTANTTAVVSNFNKQVTLQKQLLGDFFGTADPSTLPYANDLSFTTLFGYPFFEKDPRATDSSTPDVAYNYIKNAAGLNIKHVIPGNNWKGPADSREKYLKFYSAISAIQTFNAYILSQFYVESKNQYQPMSVQYQLMVQASAADWFKTISSESIGVVLRQILMYNSQTYVVLTELLQTQKQLLASQAMNNTLLILGNQFTEVQLMSKATGNPTLAQ